MPRRLVPVLTLLAAVVLLVMLNFTTPADGPFGVLIFFGAVYLMMYGVAYFLVRLFTRLLGHKAGRRSYLYSAVIAFGPIMLLLAQSLGSMSWITVGLMVIFVLLGCFLINKRLS